MSLMAWGNLSQSAHRFQRLNFRIRSIVMCTYSTLRSISLRWIHISLQCGCAISIIRHKHLLYMNERLYENIYICLLATFYRPLDTKFSFSHHLSTSVTLTSHKCKALLCHDLLISPSLSYSLQLFIRVTISALPRVVHYRVSLVSCFPAHKNDWQEN